MGINPPVVDCSPCSPNNENFNPDSDDCKRLGEELHKAFTETGFAYIINHGISVEEMTKMWNMSDDFFNLPIDVKNKALRLTDGGILGWTPYFGEKFADRPGDYKESYDFTPTMAELETLKFDKPLPKWPDEDTLPGFQKSHEHIFNKLEMVCKNFLSLFGRSMGLKDPDYLRNLHSKMGKQGNMTNLRYLKYPPIKEDVKSGQRLGPHKDFCSLTVMMQKDVGGLELCTKAGEWIYVDPKPGMFVLIAGEALEFMSSGLYGGTIHRAGLPSLDDERRHRTRRSSAFFCHPDNDSSIAPLDGSDKFPERIHRDFLVERNSAAY